MTRFLRAALAVLLTTSNLTSIYAQDKYVCGSDYIDATENCSENPGCPSGDGCPPEKDICFVVPRASCKTSDPTPFPTPLPATPNPTPEPTAEPTPAPLRVCGTNYGDALTNCRSNDECPNGDSSLCSDPSHACFAIPIDICLSDAPTPSPTPMLKVCGTSSDEAQANCPDTSVHCPSGDGCADGTACFIVPFQLCGVTNMPTVEPTKKPTESPVAPGPTPIPTEGPWQVCGSDYTDATINCRTNPKCPSGDGCMGGATCYALPPGSCPEPVAEEMLVAPDPTPAPTLAPTPPLTEAPTPAPMEMEVAMTMAPTDPMTPAQLGVCGADYSDATMNFCTNPQCPSGDGCPTGLTCYALPYRNCVQDEALQEEAMQAPEELITPAPTIAPIPAPTAALTSEPTEMVETKAPTVPTNPPTPSQLGVCGADYSDATMNFCTNPQCPSGDGCPTGLTCYALPYRNCPNPTTAPTVTPETASPTGPMPSMMPSETRTNDPTASPVFNILFCGSDYTDASVNCWTNVPCPTGAGCPNGQNCYPITAEKCMSNTPTDSPTGPGPRPSSSPTISSAPSPPPTDSLAPSPSPTAIPTESPVVNTFFCGTDYLDAFTTCSEGTACPSGGGCPGGTNCFVGITCPATTPAVEEEETQVPQTFDPNNTLYCGATYEDALENCYTNAACPNGAAEECPDGQNCFPTMGCSVPATLAPVPAVIPDSMPTGESTVMTPTTTLGTTSPPTTKWEGMFGQPETPQGMVAEEPQVMEAEEPQDTAPAVPAVVNRYCGTDAQDAEYLCAFKKPCPDGSSNNCPFGETCFPISNACEFDLSGGMTAPKPAPQTGMGESQTTMGQPTTVTQDPDAFPQQPMGTAGQQEPIAFVNPPTESPTPKYVFDPDNKRYCGTTYNDAQDFCYERSPCMSADDCSNGQNCFTIVSCETPPPTMSHAPTPGVVPQTVGSQAMGGEATPTVPTARPTTKQPQWDFAQYTSEELSSSSQTIHGKSVLLGVVLLGALVL